MDIEKLKASIAKEVDPIKLQNVMDNNAKEGGNEELWELAFRRKAELAGQNYDDPLERDFWEVLAAYEICLTKKNNGKPTRASRLRPKIKNKGFKQCLIDWAMATASTDGFELLIDKDLYEFTGEYLVLKYHERFEGEVVEAARKRLLGKGIDPNKLPA